MQSYEKRNNKSNKNDSITQRVVEGKRFVDVQGTNDCQ